MKTGLWALRAWDDVKGHQVSLAVAGAFRFFEGLGG